MFIYMFLGTGGYSMLNCNLCKTKINEKSEFKQIDEIYRYDGHEIFQEVLYYICEKCKKEFEQKLKEGDKNWLMSLKI